LVAMALTLGACTSGPESESTGQYIDSSVITAKVKAKILEDDQLKVLQISVETFKGVVLLSGFVDSDAMKARATQVAASVEGVRQVKNNLEVKPGG